MIRIDRRALLTGFAAFAAAPAFAKAPLAGTQVPGVYRRRIGDIELTALLDGFVALDASVFSGVTPEEMTAILASQGLTALPPTPVNTFLVNSGERTILIDSGAGATQAFGPNLGRLSANLAAAGVEPSQIDAVVLTHAHTDHAEGLIDAAGAALFPNAEVVLHEAEHAFWHDDAAMAGFPEGARFLFDSARRSLAPYAARTRRVADGEIFPGVTLTRSPGHTPGHAVVSVASGSEQALLLGDSLHNAAIHGARPRAGFAFDVDPAMAAASRIRLFDRAAADGLLVAATHVAFPSLGRIVKAGDGYDYVPEAWSATL